jgi:hypothetical protein
MTAHQIDTEAVFSEACVKSYEMSAILFIEWLLEWWGGQLWFFGKYWWRSSFIIYILYFVTVTRPAILSFPLCSWFTPSGPCCTGSDITGDVTAIAPIQCQLATMHRKWHHTDDVTAIAPMQFQLPTMHRKWHHGWCHSHCFNPVSASNNAQEVTSQVTSQPLLQSSSSYQQPWLAGSLCTRLSPPFYIYIYFFFFTISFCQTGSQIWI